MEFTQEVIERIELAMGFKLYKWQEHYLLNDFGLNHNYRCAGNTTIYAIKKLLTLEEVIDIDSFEIRRLCDYDPTGKGHIGWFKKELRFINDKLTLGGFITCLKVNQEPAFEITLEHKLSKLEIKASGQKVDYDGLDYISIDNGPLIVLKPHKYNLVPVEEKRKLFW